MIQSFNDLHKTLLKNLLRLAQLGAARRLTILMYLRVHSGCLPPRALFSGARDGFSAASNMPIRVSHAVWSS